MAGPVEIAFEFRNRRFSDAGKGLEAFSRALGTGFERAAPALSRELRNFLDSVAEALAQRHGRNWPGGTGGKTLSRRSGAAMRSVKDSVRVSGSTFDAIQGGIGGVFYLRPHEHGATIRAKKAKYLTIPLPAALNSNGTPKKKSAREWNDTFVAQSKNGNLLIFQRRGSQVIPLYVLKTEVRIPPRLGMGDTLRAGLPYFIDKSMNEMLKELRKA